MTEIIKPKDKPRDKITSDKKNLESRSSVLQYNRPKTLLKLQKQEKKQGNQVRKDLLDTLGRLNWEFPDKNFETSNTSKVSDASFYNDHEDKYWSTWALWTKLRYSTDNNQPTSCAANWGKFPPGTKLRVNGKLYLVEDYGSFVNKFPNRIDRYAPGKYYKEQLDKNPKVEIVQMWDFSKAISLLKGRNPWKNKHVAMMLQQAQSRIA